MTASPHIERYEFADEGLFRDVYGEWVKWEDVERLLEQLEMALHNEQDQFDRAERGYAAVRRYDAFIRDTIALWDAKGPMIASDALRERFLAFTMVEAAAASGLAKKLKPDERKDKK